MDSDDYSVSYMDSYGNIFSYTGDIPSFSKDYLPLLIQLGVIYTIPLHVLEFCSKVLTMDLASKLFINPEENKNMSLKHMFQNSIDLSIMKGTFITSLYTLALSNCILIAFPWTVSNCFALASTFWCYIIFGMICFIAIGKLLMVYLEWSAIWDMSIVISVLDGIYGIGAMRVSYYFISGGSGIFVQIGVLIVLNTLKWVACVIYFNDCKERRLEKKIDDVEMGKDKVSASSSSSSFQALIFDCDGVILESEHLHRQAYNDAFLHFNVRSPSSSQPLNWDIQFYDQLQNQIGGGKPKMRWYFKEHGWPSSTLFETPPTNDEQRAELIDTLQDWKTERYKDIIKSGSVKPRPGVLRLMDEARDAGKKLAVCSAATKSSVILCLENLIGNERFQSLDCFLAGDDVKEKKPDPSIYLAASKKLGISEKNCLVVEDSVIGLQAASKAGMSCVITYTSSTAEQDFKEAIAIYPDLSNVSLKDLELLLQDTVAAK
ncbi:CBBY protein [Trifolium repens]|nr:CBBY protein [Trifolium repens]